MPPEIDDNLDDDPDGQNDGDQGEGADDQDQEGQDGDEDADGEGGDADPDAHLSPGGEDGEDDDGEPPVRGGGRANETIRSLRSRLQETERRLNELATGRPPAQQQRMETPQEREARLALLDPFDRMQTELRETQELMLAQNRQTAFQLADQTDKATFDALAQSDPLYKKWAPRVETELQNLRRNNQNVSRKDLLYYLVGKQALEGRNSSGARQQRRAAQQRVNNQRTRPANGRSDAGTRQQAQGRNDAERRERRLEDMPL